MSRLKIWDTAGGVWRYIGGDHARSHTHGAVADGVDLSPKTIFVTQAGANNTVFSTAVSGDAFNRFLLRTDGQMSWGSGALNQDVYIYRSAAKILLFDSDGAGTTLTALDFKGALLRGFSGTAFPASPTTNDRFYRTDLTLWFFFDGTRWMTEDLFTCQLRSNSATVQPYAATTATVQVAGMPSLQGGSDLWIESHMCTFLVAGGGTALGAAHKWVGTVQKGDSAAALTTVATVNIDSGASAAWRRIETTVNALINTPTTFFFFATTWTKTGTPGTLQALEEIHYRIVAT